MTLDMCSQCIYIGADEDFDLELVVARYLRGINEVCPMYNVQEYKSYLRAHLALVLTSTLQVTFKVFARYLYSHLTGCW